MNDNAVRAAGATAIAEALKVNAVLTNLDLSMNGKHVIPEHDGIYDGIGADGAKALAEALRVQGRRNAGLTHLDVAGNYFGEEGAKALANALKVNAVLTKLNVRYNQIGDEGAKALALSLIHI